MVAVVATGLSKQFGSVEAVRGIDLVVETGELVAILGPNGAGKTTAVSMLTGFLRPTNGTVSVLGHDPTKATVAFREAVGVMLQESAAEPYLSVRETLEYYGSLYSAPQAPADLIELVGLTESADARVRTLSGGQRRRLDLALALVGDPDLVFLDEPTTGFDPEVRREAWDTIRSLNDSGTTVLMTTHYLEEADTLASRVVVLVDGHIIADGPPGEIGSRAARQAMITFEPPAGAIIDDLPYPVDVAGGRWLVRSDEPTRALHELTGWALDHGVELGGLAVSRPSLEEAYLELIR